MSEQRLSIGGVKRMARPIVKYLDPVSGGYEFATVVDIGDLRNLNTTIKSDIVGAINSIISDGVHNPVNDERIENLETIIDSLKDGTFQIEDFGSIDEHLKQKFLEELDKINAQNREEMQSVLTKLDTSVDDAIRGYQEKVAAQNIILENAENTLVDARGTLEAKAAELETAKIGFSELRTEFDELDGYITTNIRTIDFDNFNAMVEDYETIVTQTSTEVGVDMSGSTLSYLTGRVTEAEANISAQADEITSKMSYDEFQYMPVPKYSYGENLLFDTFDFGDAWSGKNGAQVTPDTFLFGKVVAFNSPTGLYETRTDDLTIGESYVLSTYVNVQPSEKGPSQDKYEPISTSYDPTDFKVQIGGKSFNPGVYEDLSGINGWVRVNQEFVADAVNPIISITPVGVNSQSEVAYMAMPKVEKGLTVTPWQPHVEDNYATISSTQSMIKQQANSIMAFVTEVSELDDSYKQATSTFKMLADGFEANTEAVKNYEDAVIRYGTEYSNINGKFEQKVWKDDFKTAIEDINIDNRNRVLNSDFIRSEISSSDRRLIVEDWSLNSDWEIKTIDNDKYLSRNRTGLTQNLITSASSNYFPVRNGERILFGFDLIHSGLDDDKVFAIELFDISDKRLLKQEFSLSSLAKVGNRYHGSFSISTPGVEKGSVVLQLPKNGSVSFTKILFQNADIGSVDWSPAPEDSWIIQSKLETYISQVEDEITIGGTGQKLDTLTGLLTEDKGTFTLNPDKIASEVLNSKTYDDMGFVNKTNFEQTADGWIQEITSEGRLAGYINASPDTYRISFDKILLEGTTWADALGSSKIMVTENFALMGKNGKPVLDVKNDGSINMNITSLKIGEYNALTTNDKSDIESEVADKVINTTKPYIHIAYADTEDGQGLSFNPSGKQYIGFAKSHLPTPSGTASNYEWSKYVGADGYEGADGVGIKSTTVRYASSTSGTSQPSTGWSSTIPTVEPGNYLWTEIVWTYTNSEKKQSYTVARIGADGANGKDGVAGKDGVGIQKTEVHYASSTSGTTKPSTGWNLTVPTTSPGNYLWTRTTWTYTDGSKEEGYSVSRIGKDGNTGKDGIAGKDGVGIKSTVINYATSSSGTTKPTSGWTSTIPSVAPGNYLWTRTVWTYTDNDVETGYSVSRIGEKGDKGDTGAAGTGIKSSEISYVIHTNGTTAPTLGWVSTVPSPVKGRYLWTRTITTYTDNTTSTTYSVAYQATDGQRGDTGATGNGISSTTVTYAQTTSGTTTPTSWSSTRPAPIKGQYLWSRTIITYTNGSSSTAYNTSYSATDGQKGDKGDTGPRGPQGIQGPSGSNGQSQWVHIRYSANSNGASMTTSPSSTTKYVGIAVTNSSSAPSYTGFTWSKYVGEDGDRGPQGVKGDKGLDTYTWVRYADEKDGTGISNFPDGKKFIGLAYNKTTPTESNNPNDYQWSAMYDEEAFKGVGLADKTELLSGTEIYTDKADNSVVHVEIDGESYQHAKENSKNLAPHLEHWELSGGATFDGNSITIPLNGAITAWIPWDGARSTVRIGFDVISGSNMHMSTNYYAEDKRTPVNDVGGNGTGNGYVTSISAGSRANAYSYYTIDNNVKYVLVSITGSSGYVSEPYTISNISVRSDSYAYEPPAPTPDYPIEIHSVNDFDVVSSVGKRNLIKGNDKLDAGGWFGGGAGGATQSFRKVDMKEEWGIPDAFEMTTSGGTQLYKSVFTTNTTSFVSMKYNQAYRVSMYVKNVGSTRARVATNGLQHNGEGNTYVEPGQSIRFTHAGYRRADFDWFQVHLNAVATNQNIKVIIGGLQVEEVDSVSVEASPYAPASEDITESENYPLIDKINLLLDEPLRSVGDVKDRLFRDSDGLWKVERNVAEVKFDSSDSWEINTTWSGDGLTQFLYRGNGKIPNVTTSRNVMSSHGNYKAEGWKYAETGITTNGTSVPNSYLWIKVSNAIADTAPKFLQWLDLEKSRNNPLTFVYQRYSQEIETLDQELQDKLNNLRSFQDSNYVYTVFSDKSDIISEKLKPTLHATFKGGGWYSRWKTEDDLRKHQAEINDKASAEDLTDISNDLNTSIGDLSNTVDGKVDKSMYEEFLEHNANIQEQLSTSTANAQEDITKALARTATVEQKLGEGAADWIFTHTQIRMSDEGITLGEEGSGSYLQITNDQISFYNGSEDPVAFINGGMLNINHAIFVESIQISEFMFSSEISGHLTLRYVGN